METSTVSSQHTSTAAHGNGGATEQVCGRCGAHPRTEIQPGQAQHEAGWHAADAHAVPPEEQGQAMLVPQLFYRGDSMFPGIGVPVVVATGAIVANTLASVAQHSEMLNAIR